jgi:hypothetical protein
MGEASFEHSPRWSRAAVWVEKTGKPLNNRRELRTDGVAVSRSVGETDGQPFEHPTNASTNRSGRLW